MGSVQSASSGSFEPSELVLLEHTFQDLASRSLFKLPGLLGERLFAVFDKDSNLYIEKDEFISGVAILTRGTINEKINFMFKMFNMDNTPNLNKEEVRAMLNSIVAASSAILESRQDAELQDEVHIINEATRNQQLTESVEELLTIAFEHSDSLSLQQFESWVLSNTEIFDVFDDTFFSSFGLPSLRRDQSNSTSDPSLKNNKREMSRSKSEILREGNITRISIAATSPTRISIAATSPVQSDDSFSKVSTDIFSKEHTPRISNADATVTLTNFKSPHPLGSMNGSPKSINPISTTSFSWASALQSKPPVSRHVSYANATGLPIGSSNGISTAGISKPYQTPPSSNNSSRRSVIPHAPKVVNCNNCGLDIKFSFCFACGTILGNDIRCKTCGEHFNPMMVRYCMSCGFDFTLNNIKLEPTVHIQGPASSRGRKKTQEALMQGVLYKLGATFKQLTPRWYVIKDRFLYSFRDRTDLQPTSVLFLEGCFVENVPAQSEKLRYGFDIIISDSNENEQKKTLYAKSKEECDQWIAAVRGASNVHNIDEYYDVGPELGVGRFSSVRLGTHKVTGKKYAIKIIDKTDMDLKEKEALRAEIAILKLVRHPNVVQLKNQFETRKSTYIVMTLFQGGDLFDRLVAKKRFSEILVKSIVVKMLTVVKYLHDRGIVHRDLKPENIGMVSNERDDDILIGDFGLSKFTAPHEVMKLPCGTLAYVAPEVLSMKGYGHKIDIWSVGVITYLLIRGRLPFDSRKKEEVVQKAKSGIIDFSDDLWKSIHHDTVNFIRNCLAVDPDKRFSVEQALAHPFVTSYQDPYPDLTAKDQLRHQTNIQQMAVMHMAQTFCTCKTTTSWVNSLWNDFYHHLQSTPDTISVPTTPNFISSSTSNSNSSFQMIFKRVESNNNLALFGSPPQNQTFAANPTLNQQPYFWDNCSDCGLSIALPPYIASGVATTKQRRPSNTRYLNDVFPSGYISNLSIPSSSPPTISTPTHGISGSTDFNASPKVTDNGLKQ